MRAGAAGENAPLLQAAQEAVAMWKYSSAAVCHFAAGKVPADRGDCRGAERVEPVAVTLQYAFTFEIVKGQHVVRMQENERAVRMETDGAGLCPASSGPALDVGLYRRLHQLRFFQRRIAGLAHADELRLGHAVVHVDVVRALFADGGFVGEVAAARAVVVADEHAGGIRQGQQALDRAVQLCGITAGKSQRAVPPSGMNSESPVNSASSIR
jgi:hypothetical protein